jgi:hypothetical protein
MPAHPQGKKLGGEGLKQINSCGKESFCRVTFKTKIFCIAFYEFYPSTVETLQLFLTPPPPPQPNPQKRQTLRRQCVEAFPLPFGGNLLYAWSHCYNLFLNA